MIRRGESIPDSHFVRDFCDGCGEPIRVVSAGRVNLCNVCKPIHYLGMGGGNSDVETTEIQYHGSRFCAGEW